MALSRSRTSSVTAEPTSMVATAALAPAKIWLRMVEMLSWAPRSTWRTAARTPTLSRWRIVNVAARAGVSSMFTQSTTAPRR